jgi:tetratricopeptide (TPR) repeat protein
MKLAADAPQVQINTALAHRSFSEAESLAKLALANRPNSLTIQLLLAQALGEQGKDSEVDSLLRSAVEQHSGVATANLVYGTWLQGKGRFQEAKTYLQTSLELQPAQAMAYLSLAKCGPFIEEDRVLVQKMEALSEPGQLDPLQRSYLHYALGKAKEDLGDFQAAMMAFDTANQVSKNLHDHTRNFDPERYADTIQRVKTYFSEQLFREFKQVGNPSSRPIFVVGMPRSGTTLLEQMLSCHSQVGAAGELSFWMRRGSSIFDQNTGKPELHRSRALAEEYDELLRSTAPWARHVTDKMPLNFIQLGHIRLLMPNARILHIRRNPLDTCLSIYTTDFRNPPPYGHSQENIVLAYRLYQELMLHWKRVVPANRLLEVEYEQLVNQPEEEIKKVLQFCGLGFEEKCTRPESNPRPIRTPSLWQARQPVYRSSIGRATRFEPWLGALSSLRESPHLR